MSSVDRSGLLLERVQSSYDYAEDVIRRLLGAYEETSSLPAGVAVRATEPERTAPGSILPEREYWRPIVRYLLSMAVCLTRTTSSKRLARRWRASAPAGFRGAQDRRDPLAEPRPICTTSNEGARVAER